MRPRMTAVQLCAAITAGACVLALLVIVAIVVNGLRSA